MHLWKIKKQELAFKQKRCITQGLQISFKKKNAIFSKYIWCKNSATKTKYYINYKNYRKLISIAQRSRTKMFKNNTIDVKKT